MFGGLSIGVLLAINVFYAAVILAIGFAFGFWFFGAAKTNAAPSNSPRIDEDELRRASERITISSTQVADVAQNIICDVDVHASKVGEFDADLREICSGEITVEPEKVFATIGRMMLANGELQRRLTQAQQQIADQTVELRNYESETRTDSLTGLANRRAFDDELQRRFAEWQRHRIQFALVMLDIDHFKSFNDLHGHQAGDEVLRQVSQVLAATCRQSDVACRYGGEEFAVVLSRTGSDEARRAGDRFRTAIAAAKIEFQGQTFSVTASVGVALIGESDDSLRLVRRADDALYTSKQAGRDCGHWHNGQQCLPLAGKQSTAHHRDSRNEPQAVQHTVSNAKFVEALELRVVDHQKYGIPVSLMHVQIDGCKRLAEQFGPTVVQTAAEAVALHTESVIREIDIVTHLDDGELIVLLPGSTEAEAAQLAKRWQFSFKASSIQFPDSETQLHVTQNVAQLRPGETATKLIDRARAQKSAAALAT